MTVAKPTTESPVDLATNDLQGSVIITDPQLLIRPPVPGQYPERAPHDPGRVYDIMELGNDQQGNYEWHIICREDPQAAIRLLDRIFSAYVDLACMELWCDARAVYTVNGEPVLRQEYGFEETRYTMVFQVHCSVGADEAEELIAKLSSEQLNDFFVVRPDSSEQGFTVRGFTVERPALDNGYTQDDTADGDYLDVDADTEDPLAGDVEPTGGYPEPSAERPWGTPHIPPGQ